MATPTVKSRQSAVISTSAASTDTVLTTQLTNLSASWILQSYAGNAGTDFPNEAHWRAKLSSISAANFTRDTAGVTTDIGYQVIEFNNGVTVETGQVTISAVDQVVTTTKSDWDIDKTFVVARFTNTGTTFGNDDVLAFRMLNSSQFQMHIIAINTNVVEYQVIQFDDATVQYVDNGSDDASQDLTISITSAVDPLNSFIIPSNYGGSNMNADDLRTYSLSANGQAVRAYTPYNSTPSSLRHIVQIIEMPSITVEHGTYELTGTSGTISINTVDVNRSLVVMAAGQGYINPGNLTTDQIDIMTVRAVLNSDSLEFHRKRSTSEGTTISYQVVQFSAGALIRAIMRGVGRGIMRGVT